MIKSVERKFLDSLSNLELFTECRLYSSLSFSTLDDYLLFHTYKKEICRRGLEDKYNQFSKFCSELGI